MIRAAQTGAGATGTPGPATPAQARAASQHKTQTLGDVTNKGNRIAIPIRDKIFWKLKVSIALRGADDVML